MVIERNFIDRRQTFRAMGPLK
jgi:hypothetical protein